MSAHFSCTVVFYSYVVSDRRGAMENTCSHTLVAEKRPRFIVIAGPKRNTEKEKPTVDHSNYT